MNELQKRLEKVTADSEAELMHHQEEMKQLKGEWFGLTIVDVTDNIV